jgi:uncharacterized protein
MDGLSAGRFSWRGKDAFTKPKVDHRDRCMLGNRRIVGEKMSRVNSRFRCVAVAFTLVFALSGVSRGDIGELRVSEFLTALQNNDYAEVERVCIPGAKAYMPQLKAAWQQQTALYGKLKSFDVVDHGSSQGVETIVANLNFERPSGLAAKVSVDAHGRVATLLFVAVQASSEAKKVADERVNELLDSLRARNFDAAENHFDPQMRSQSAGDAFKKVWNARIASLGNLNAWRIVARAEQSGNVIRIVDLDFAKGAQALALKLAIIPSGEIGGLYFLDAQPDHLETPPYIRSSAFTLREVKVGRKDAPLGGTITIPKGKGPFSAAVLVQGTGATDRDENIYNDHPFKDIAEGLSSNGIAVLRYDKRTHVYPTLMRYVSVNNEFIDDAVAAVGLLKQQPEVDPTRVFVIGHSLGAMLAPEIAVQAKAAGVIMLSPLGLPLPDVLVRQDRYLELPKEQIAQAEESARLLKAKALSSDYPIIDLNVTAAYLYDLDSRNEVAYARKLGRPILILHGARDFQVVDADIDLWRKGLKGTPDVTIETLPNLNHLFIAGRGKPSPDEYMVPSYVAPEVITKLSSFIERSK